MSRWYSRPVIFVADVDRASSFYVEKLGFAEAWRHCEQDKTLVAQVDRAGCELILSCQQPGKVGCALVFISLDQADVAPVRRSFDQAGVDVKEGWWGYPLMIVADPDGNELYFPVPATAAY
jgi:catechol 2,3-dioxygenase-like lactoylglutathione lyase family enzyme